MSKNQNKLIWAFFCGSTKYCMITLQALTISFLVNYQYPGFSLQGRWGNPPSSRIFAHPPPEKTSLSRLPQRFIPQQRVISPSLNKFSSRNYPTQNSLVIACVSCSIYICVVFILILINVRYLQNVPFSIEKGSNGRNPSAADSPSHIKKSPLQKNFALPSSPTLGIPPTT